MVPYHKTKKVFLDLCKKIHTSPKVHASTWQSIVRHASEINEIISVSILKAKSTKPKVHATFVHGFEDENFCLSHYPDNATELIVVKFPHRTYWHFHDLEEIYALPVSTNSVDCCLDIALRILKREAVPFSIVCGPISTGPGSLDENLKAFNKTIHALSRVGPVFSQMPFEDLFKKLHETAKHTHVYSGQIFLDNFYIPLFAFRKITKAFFMYGWWLSCGASQERGAFRALGIPVEDLPKDFLERNFQ